MSEPVAVSTLRTAELEVVRGPRRRRRRRYLVVVLALLAAIVTAALLTLSLGAIQVSVQDIVRVLLGHGTDRTDFVVLQLRLPRVVLAIVAGSALALAGTLFQTLLRNDLASPDILGITGGASVAAVVGGLLLGAGGLALTAWAFGGAIVVAVLIYLLAWDPRGAGNRFVLVGIGVAFMVTATLNYVLTRADVQQAQVALAWLVGSIGDADWTTDAIAAACLGVLLLPSAGLGRTLHLLQLGDDTARGLGVPVQRRRLGVLALAVGLAAVGVAAAGPLAFVAFVSGPIARRMVRDGTPALIPSALVGSAVVLVADLVGQHFVPGGTRLPAGVLTGVIGAPYLLWLLTRSTRSSKATT